MTVTTAPPSPESLVDSLVPGPSPRRQLLVLAAILLAGFALVVAPSESFKNSYQDWRYLDELDGELRTLDGPAGLRSQAATVALGDGRVLLWGGRDQGNDSGVIYDPAGDRWEALPPAPGPNRFGASAVWTGQEALIWGGSISTASFDFDPGGIAYDPDAGTWRSLPRAPLGLMAARAVAFDGGVLFTGGQQQVLGVPTPSLWLDRATQTWTQIPTPFSTVNTARRGDQLLATGPPALAAGRQGSSGWPVHAFDVETLSWTSFADPLETEWMALAVSREGRLSAVSRAGLNEAMEAFTWNGSGWEQVARSSKAAGGLVTIEYVSYPPVAVRTDTQLLLGGSGGLTGWDPDREVLSHTSRVDGALETFGGSAVWTGREVVALSNQINEGWVWTPRAG